ncbi:glycosyltransferase family 4 protein [Cerasicoccus fimbriatus]|uniref:glycosyltransferase family 4 protein n=1 Tax=Cerasicoccus fimbriatus TaxID=3014554 RepID=UPI0022B3CD84|nr:glycosyltransferase family 4 protein [Cerasicoccus sp. TK19100]
MTEKPHITFCAFDKPGNIGGPASWLIWLMPALQKRGFAIHCLVFLHTGEDGPLVKFLEQNKIPHAKTHNPHYVQDSIRWTLAQLQQTPTDVFLPNVVTSAFYACKWVRQAGIATVGILHSDYEYCDALQEEFVAGQRDFRLSGMVGVSRELKRQINSCASDATSVYRIPYGAPVPGRCVSPPTGKLRIGFFGRLVTEQKKILNVVRAFCHTAKEVPGVELYLYGDGPEKDAAAALLTEIGQGLPVYFGGSIPSTEIQDTMLQCHVIVLLSDYEGLPIALMEAMACGVVPICRFNKSGIPELIEDGVNGYILDDSTEALTGAIKKLLAEPNRWAEFSRASREKILQEYTMDHGADIWADVLRDQIKRWRKPGRINIPKWISLPSPNPAINNAGERKRPIQSYLKHKAVRSRMFAGKIKRIIIPRA